MRRVGTLMALLTAGILHNTALGLRRGVQPPTQAQDPEAVARKLAAANEKRERKQAKRLRDSQRNQPKRK